MHLLQLLIALIVFASPIHSACECGYTVNSTTSPTHALYTDLFETDFSHLYHIPSSDDLSTAAERAANVGWQPQAYNVTPAAARGPYGKQALVGNVVPNPSASRRDWGGEGVLGGDPGSQIWVRGIGNLTALAADDGGGQMVKIGEIDGERDDVSYGSFRVGMKASGVSGTCAAFFWYRNNTNEIDLEYLSAQTTPLNTTGPINLVSQSPLSASLGYNAASTSTFNLYNSAFNPSAGYHEYRFDWSPTRIDFYFDGTYASSFTTNIPSAPGRSMSNHWSNGDAGWSQGPPATDAVLTLSYVKAYFNSSNATRTASYSTSCPASSSPADLEARTCEIPDQSASIEPTGPAGNETGKTFFFTLEGNSTEGQTVYPAATAGPSGSAGNRSPVGWVPYVACAIAFSTLTAVVVGVFAMN